MNRSKYVVALLLLPTLIIACKKKDIHNPNDINQTNNNPDRSKYQVYVTQDPGTSKRIYASTTGKAPINGRVYLWDEHNIPVQILPIDNGGNAYADPLEFRPFVEVFTIPHHHQPKGAIILCAGGGFAFRANHEETYPTMHRLIERGYQVFIVQYRVRPWTMADGLRDVARAIRFVRSHAAEYRISTNQIAAIGYSAGGLLLGEQARHQVSDAQAMTLENGYKTDEIDKVDAKVSALGMIYSLYLQLETTLQRHINQLPPTFFAYGSDDPLYRPIGHNIHLLKEAGNLVESKIIQDYKHGFGAGQSDADWIDAFDTFVQSIFVQ